MSSGRSAPRWDYDVEQHAELIAWEAAEDALRGEPEGPAVYDIATMEYAPERAS